MTIGEKIRQLRLQQGMTLEKVGKAAGLSRQRIHGIEVSKSMPTIPVLMQIAESLNCTVFDLIDEPLGRKNSTAAKRENNKPCANSSICPFYKGDKS